MSTLTIFSPKINSATVFEDFNFISMLAVGETISSALVTSTVFSGEDINPEDILSGVPSVVNTIVSQLVTDGEVGVIYLLSCAVTTSLGNVKIMQGCLAVVDTNPY